MAKYIRRNGLQRKELSEKIQQDPRGEADENEEANDEGVFFTIFVLFKKDQ